jgi:hypothetical protein
VPWNYGIDRVRGEETRIYTDRLAEAWARDSRRGAVLEESGLPFKAVPDSTSMKPYGRSALRPR